MCDLYLGAFKGRWISNAADEKKKIPSQRQMSRTGDVNRDGFVFFLTAMLESIGVRDNSQNIFNT